jgi:hypothetical protein
MTNCCDANGNCNQGRDCPVRKRHTDRTANGSEPTGPLDEIDKLVTASEATIIFLVITLLTGVWVAALAIVSGYAWQRWLADFFGRALAWLVLP